MKTLRHLLRVALPLVAAATFGAPRAQAQSVAPNPAPTVITSAPYTINQPGYYVLGADLVYGGASGNIITVNASNVTVDFDGHYISGSNTANGVFGILANEQGNLTVKNGTIAYCYCGIYFEGNGKSGSLNINQTVTNMLVTYCYNYGVYSLDASNSRYTNNRLSFNGAGGGGSIFALAFDGGSGNLVADNVVSNTGNSNMTVVYAIYGTGSYDADHNKVTSLLYKSGNTATGILNPIFGTRNTVVGANIGMAGGVLQGNLTKSCASAGLGGGYNDGGQNASF